MWKQHLLKIGLLIFSIVPVLLSKSVFAVDAVDTVVQTVVPAAQTIVTQTTPAQTILSQSVVEPSNDQAMETESEAPVADEPVRIASAPRMVGIDPSRIRENCHTSSSEHHVISKPLSYRRSQRIMLQSAPPGGNRETADSNTAFNLLMRQNVPLTPRQVIRLRQLIDNSQRAAAVPAHVPPKPVSTTIMMNLAPGTTPPAIRLASGYVSSLVFVDSTGAPWPIASYDIGDPKATRIQWDGKSNVLLIQGVSPYSNTDLVVRLGGLMTPLTLTLISGQRVVDFRTDIHVSGIGPNATEIPIGTALPNSANQLLLDVLDGVGPPGSKLLAVIGGDGQAWLSGDRMYLRTRLTLLSPGWIGKMVSPDGMNAYEIQRSPTVLVSQYGNPIELKVEGF